MSDFEKAVCEAIAALSYAVHSIYTNGLVWEGDVDRVADAIDGLNAVFAGPNDNPANVIQFPRRPEC